MGAVYKVGSKNYRDIPQRALTILQYIAEGYSDPAIAAKLGLSVETVKTYNRLSFSLLKANSRTLAVMNARDLGILPCHCPNCESSPSTTVRVTTYNDLIKEVIATLQKFNGYPPATVCYQLVDIFLKMGWTPPKWLDTKKH